MRFAGSWGLFLEKKHTSSRSADGKYSYFFKEGTNFKFTIIDNVDEVDFVDAIAPDGEALDAGIETDVVVDLAG